jgi:exportin-2 (importin alpha re-exporter)
MPVLQVVSEHDAYGGIQQLPDAEKAQIKVTLPGLMLATPPLVQAQLSEALSIICSQDFPVNWPNLLPELVRRLDGADLATTSGVLATANSIFKR